MSGCGSSPTRGGGKVGCGPRSRGRASGGIARGVWARWGWWCALGLVLIGMGGMAWGQAAGSAGPSLTVSLGGGENESANVSSAIQIVVLMTVLTLAPSLLMLMTSFTRMVIVLGFIRGAIGLQGAPSNQILVGMSLFLTLFVMTPTAKRVNEEALQPYLSKQISTVEFGQRASVPLKAFMLKQTRPSEVDFFLGVSGQGAMKAEDVPLTVVVPAFVMSELRTAFQMGFLIYIPFLVIDFLVSATLMSMGMMMMPPMMISLPFKLLLFVLVDGWHLIVRSLVESFVA